MMNTHTENTAPTVRAHQDIMDALAGGGRVSILTGAGVSVASDIPDFKSTDENWEDELSRMEVISRPYFEAHPEHFWEVYAELLLPKVDVAPNAFHHWVAQLEASPSHPQVTVITQNVDGLHVGAGSSDVIEVHGSARRLRCVQDECPVQQLPLEEELLNVIRAGDMPRCATCSSVLKPDTVLFGESVHDFTRARDAVILSHTLLVVGTSLDVGPVNMLPQIGQEKNMLQRAVWVNQEAPPSGYQFQVQVLGDLAELFTV
jgi:NAD-dependent deacetylase